MLYGALYGASSAEEVQDLTRLRNATAWKGSVHHSVMYGDFRGGLFLDPRLPYTVADFLYIDTQQELMVLMSGQIYNQSELCTSSGFSRPITSSAALIAHLFVREGTDFINRLNGDFAVVIYQPGKNAFLLFRDHIGIEPLAYTTTAHGLFFSTDCISLCRTFQMGERIHIDALLAHIKLVDMTETPNKRVLKLKAGHFLTFTEAGITIKKYWEPECIRMDKTLSQERMFAELKSLLHDAVRIRADQRFRAGAHVSGGFDSTTVAALARKEYPHQFSFYGYSWSPINTVVGAGELDERDLIREACDMAGIEPVFSQPQVNDLVELTKHSLDNLGDFNEANVLSRVQHTGTNLLFSGWGGDEFISFGSMGVDADLFFNFQWKTFLKKNPLRNPKKILKLLVFRVFLPAIHFIPPKANKNQQLSLKFFKNEYKTTHLPTLRSFYCFRSRQEFQVGMIYTYHLSERTEYWAVAGYKNGATYRYPLLDKRIIEYMLKVPSKLLVKDSTYTRIILREITEGLLPDSIRWRVEKGDNALFALMSSQMKDRALLFIDEVSEFKKNPDLYFVDFDLLEQAIGQFRNDEEKYLEPDQLFESLIVFKTLHELTTSYASPINDWAAEIPCS